MTDNLNKDNINSNLEGDGTENPLKSDTFSEPDEQTGGNSEEQKPESEVENTESADIPEETETAQEEKIIETNETDEDRSEDTRENTEESNSGNESEENEKVTDDKAPENIEGEAAESNYQITLVDERVLRVRTATNLPVSIDCNVIQKGESQANKIYIPPAEEEKKQEVEVLVKIGAEAVQEETISDTPEAAIQDESKKKESNYQISLVNENVLRVKISTNKSVSVDSLLLDKTNTESVEERQSNKIFIHPKPGKQDVEIFIRIGDETFKAEKKEVKSSDGTPVKFKTPGLTPNPLVADILSRFAKPSREIPKENLNGLTDEEKLELRIGRRNPWKINKEFLKQNLQRGFVAANIITIIAAIVFFAFGSGKMKEGEEVITRRLIVMQDLPENLNQLTQNVDDPNKPPEEPKTDGETGTNVTIPKITPKRITPPRVNLPKLDTKLTENDSALNKELDSLRKTNITGNENKNGKVDTTAVNKSLMPDSLLKNLSENEVGLIGRFPPNWKQIDARDLNQTNVFTGVILVDTTVKKEETITMNIEMDVKGDRFNQFQFKNIFDEDSLRTVYAIEPKTEGKLTYYRFYVASKSDNVFVNTFVIQPMFEKYKDEIERVVKSIRIRKPEPK